MDGVDIITKVFMMASQMAMPREVHLEAVLYVYESFCQKYNSRMSFDPTYSAINMSDFKDCKWKEFYGELKKPPLLIPLRKWERKLTYVGMRVNMVM